MAVKRSKKKSKAKTASEVYEQAMAAEGAPVALDFLGFGSTIGDVIRGKSVKKAAKPRAKKKARTKTKTKTKTSRAKKKSPARKSRRKK